MEPTVTQIENWLRMFCAMGARDGVSVSGYVQGYLYADGSYHWSAALYGRADGSGGDSTVLVVGSGRAESPGDALVNAYKEYTVKLDAYLSDQVEEVGA